MPSPPSPVLEAHRLGISFGGLTAVKDFSLSLYAKEIAGLIGPNGAGKTTVFNLLTGMYAPNCGTLKVQGRPVLGMAPWRLTGYGICRTFQNLRLFQSRTVLENLLIGSHLRVKSSLVAQVLHTRAFRAEERELRAFAMDLLAEVRLERKAEHLAGTLAYGEMRRLEIARALAAKPSILLLDEPAAGMNPREGEELMSQIRRLRERFGLSLLIIEHDMAVVMNLCDRVLVLDHGETIAEGLPEEIRRHPKVIEAYLGEDE